MLSNGGNGAAAGATAQATANTNEDATDTADAQQCSDLVHTVSGKEPAIYLERRVKQAIENWRESEARERELVARNRELKHALRQLVQATRAMAAGLRTEESLVGLANQLAKANLPEKADTVDEAGAAFDDEAGAASAGDSVNVDVPPERTPRQWVPLERLVQAGCAAPSDLQDEQSYMAAKRKYNAAGADSAGNSDDDSDDDGQFVHCGKKPWV